MISPHTATFRIHPTAAAILFCPSSQLPLRPDSGNLKIKLLAAIVKGHHGLKVILLQQRHKIPHTLMVGKMRPDRPLSIQKRLYETAWLHSARNDRSAHK